MQATEQFKEDLRLLAGSYIAEMEMIINSMNGLVYTCFAKTNNILFIFRTDLEKMNWTVIYPPLGDLKNSRVSPDYRKIRK